MFLGMTKINKEGLGEIISYPPIKDADMKTLKEYFQFNMTGNANPRALQEVIIFYIIYYLCRRGRENLRKMTVNTFAIANDPDTKKEYIYQKVDEADKNHNQNDTNKANQGRIYEVPGTLNF